MGYTRKPLRGMRRIGMAFWDGPKSGTIYGSMQIDVCRALRFQDDVEAQHGIRPSIGQLVGRAVAEALACLTKPCTVVVKSDSSYVVTGLMINMHRWKANGWMKKGNQPLVHDDLWRRIYDLAETHTVIPMWVPGHAGDPLNDRADQLARQAIPVLA